MKRLNVGVYVQSITHGSVGLIAIDYFNQSKASVVQTTFKKYFNYKLPNTFVSSISITFVNYFGQVAQNTKYF